MTDSSSRLVRPNAVFELLHSWILNGSIVPGQRLPVRDVARGMGVSTMPVREALVRLEEAGLLTQAPRKGAIVNQLSQGDLNDFYNLRRLIEPPSIQMGVERMTPERLTRLQLRMDELRKAAEQRDLITVLNLDEDILYLVHAAVANKQLARVIRETWTRVRPYKLLFTTVAQADAGEFIAAEDEVLIEAAKTGHGTAAHEWMANSLANAQLRLADLLRSYHANDIAAQSGAPLDGESLATAIADLVASCQELG